jgi:hypothetical protein
MELRQPYAGGRDRLAKSLRVAIATSLTFSAILLLISTRVVNREGIENALCW